MTYDAFDLEASLVFLTSEQGGRATSVLSGYRPSHDFGLESLVCAAHWYVDGCAAPGSTVLARLKFAEPEYQQERLFPGFRFTVNEGAKVVARGTITKVLNNSLAKEV